MYVECYDVSCNKLTRISTLINNPKETRSIFSCIIDQNMVQNQLNISP